MINDNFFTVFQEDSGDAFIQEEIELLIIAAADKLNAVSGGRF